MHEERLGKGRTPREVAVCKPRREVTPVTNSAWNLDLERSSSRTVRKYMLFKPLNLWCSVPAALVD